jgi:3-mercaptopropionate dioxygenase
VSTTTTTAAVAGLDRLIGRLDQAVATADVDHLCAGVREVLHEELGARRLELPAELARPCESSYARRLLHACPEYTVVAMVWGPGQGTLLHDHGGLWCVEGVLSGEIEVLQYDQLEEVGEEARFVPQGSIRAGVGDAGSLIPPFEHHTIANPRSDGAAITIHVYGGELTDCHVFRPLDDRPEWYVREARHLSYTD